MPEPATIAVFAAAALALLVVPGPAVLYVVTQSIGQGRRAGLVSVAGLHVGSLVHVAAATVGLSSLLVSSAIAFDVVKYVGAAYLVYLGIRRLLGRDRLLAPGEPSPPRPLSRVFRQGILVELFNPKTALFFFAFLPQFVDPDRGSPALQFAILGLVFVVLGLLSDGAWALAAGTAGAWLRRSSWFTGAERWLSGAVLVALGITAALTGQRRAA